MCMKLANACISNMSPCSFNLLSYRKVLFDAFLASPDQLGRVISGLLILAGS